MPDPNVTHRRALDRARELMGEVYTRTLDERVEVELMAARAHVDRARAILDGQDPDALTIITQVAGVASERDR